MFSSQRETYDVVFYTPRVKAALPESGSPSPGGAEQQVWLLARALAARGARVAIIVFSDATKSPSGVDGVRLVLRPPYAGGRRFVGKVAEAARIWRVLSNVRARAIVYRAAASELGAIGMYARLARKRLILSTANVVDFDFASLTAKRRDRFLYELGVRLADDVVVQTEEQVELCKRAFSRSPTLIKSIAPPAAMTMETPEAFLWIGRLVWYKRPLEYLALARRLPEARFWMVGVPVPGSEHGEVLRERVAAEAAELPNLELLPPRPHADIESLMSRAVASVNTADFEGMPNVLLEGWSRGVPALVLSHDPGSVVSTYGLGGFADGARDRFVELARESWRMRFQRGEIAERCRAYVAKHHSSAVVAAQWLDTIRCTTSARSAPADEGTEMACVG